MSGAATSAARNPAQHAITLFCNIDAVLHIEFPGLWQRLFGTGVYEHEASIYGETIQEGGELIAVRVPPNEVAHARAVLDIHRPADVHDRAVTSGVATIAHFETIEKRLDAVPLLRFNRRPFLRSSRQRSRTSSDLRRNSWRSANRSLRRAAPAFAAS
jgi:hypothetical protein